MTTIITTVKKLIITNKNKIIDLSSTFLSNIVVAFCKWLILILIARLLSPKEVGIYTLAFAITAPISLLINMKLRSLYVTDECANSFIDYFHLRLILNVISFLILSVIAFFIWKDIFWILLVVMLNKLTELLSENVYSAHHKKKSFYRISKMMIQKSIIEVVSFGFALVIFKSLIYALIVSLILKTLYVFLVELPSIYYLIKNNHYNINKVLKILRLALPLGLVQMIVSLNTNIPRYFLEYFEDVTSLGLFSSVAYLLVIFNLFASSISQFFLPKLYEINQSGNTKMLKNYINKKMNVTVIFIGIIITLFLFIFGEQVLTIIYGSEYSKMKNLLVIVSLSTLLNTISWNYDTALMAIRYISVQPKITIFTLLINIIISHQLINEHGIYGAALSLIIVSLLQLILRVYFFNRRLERSVLN